MESVPDSVPEVGTAVGAGTVTSNWYAQATVKRKGKRTILQRASSQIIHIVGCHATLTASDLLVDCREQLLD